MIYSDLYLTTKSGTRTLLPQAYDKTFDVQGRFKASTISFEIPTDAAKAVGLTEGSFVSVSVDENILPTPYVIEGSGFDYVTEDGISTQSFKGRSIHALGEDAIVLPSAWPNPTPSGHAFQNVTPGTILKTLFTRAQQRGSLQEWDHSTFSGTVDSNGKSWPSMMDRNYSNGDTLLSVCQSLVDDGLIELDFNGFQIRAYVPGTLGKTIPPEKVFFQAGYSLSDGSFDRDASGFATDVFAIGDGATATLETRSELYGILGRRREKFVQYGGIGNVDLLKVLAKADLDRMSLVKQEDTLGVLHEVYQPFVDYNIEDWVQLYRTDGTMTLVQIKQISVREGKDGEYSVGVTLGTLIDSMEEKFQRRLDAITGANAGGGAVPNDKNQIKIAPGPPQNLSVSAQPYLDNQMRRKVIAIADWSDVIVYDNGTPLNGVDNYEVAIKAGNASDYGPASVVQDSKAVFSGYDPDTKVQIKVRAFAAGLASAWVESSVFTLTDTTPVNLAKPSTPSLSVRWQTVGVTWDGKNADGSWPSRDTLGVEVHMSKVNNFTPDTSTRMGFIQLIAGSQVGGNLIISDLDAKTPYNVRLVPLANKGTAGTASDIATATTTDYAVTDQVRQIDADLKQARSDLYDSGGRVSTIQNTLDGKITTAQNKADTAQATASGKNAVFWNTNDPSDTNNPGTAWGDVWYKYTIVNNKTQILGQWYWYNRWVPSALSETFIPQLNIGTGTYGELDGFRLKANSVQANNVIVASSIGTTLIADGSITTAKLVAEAITADKIAANSITTAKLAANAVTAATIDAQSVAAATGDFVQVKAENIKAGNITTSIGMSTSGAIVAGNPNGSHAEMVSTGFRAFSTDIDGNPILATSLGTGSGDVFAVYDSGSIDPTVTISPRGDASFTTVNLDGDATIGGKGLLGQQLDPKADMGWLDGLPQGVIAFGDLRPFITTGGKLPTGTTAVATMGFVMNYNRMYRLTFPVTYTVTDVASNGRVSVGLRYTYSSSDNTPDEPTSSSTTVEETSTAYTASATNVTDSLSFVWNPANYGYSDGLVNIKLQVYIWSGACQVTPQSGSAGAWKITVEDIGPKVDDSVRAIAFTSTTAAKKTYTSVWEASDSQTFYANGTKDSYGKTNNITRAGYWNSTTGDMKTMLLFNYNAASGETSKSMSSALTGATITKAEVFIQTQHWYNSTGGTLVLRQASGSTMPSTLSDSTTKSGGSVSKQYTTRSQGFWITVPTSWFSKDNRSVYVGPANSSSQASYTHIASHSTTTAAYRPKVRLTYTR